MKCTQKKLIKLPEAATVIKDCKHLIELQHIRTELNALRMFENEMLKVCEAKEKLKLLNGKIRICKAKMKLETQSHKCEGEMYLREKEKCQMFLKNVEIKCESKM